MVKKAARDTYNTLAQGVYETIIAYKQRFDAAYEAHRDLENQELDEADVAMDFLHGLDDSRYADFKVSIINDIDRGAIVAPETVNQMYLLASRHLVVTKRPGGASIGASFATADSTMQRREARPTEKKRDNKRSEPRHEPVQTSAAHTTSAQ
jgi:hypothetical protein